MRQINQLLLAVLLEVTAHFLSNVLRDIALFNIRFFLCVCLFVF